MENENSSHHKIIKILDTASNKMNKKFAQFRKCVFHVHTPASHDYKILGQEDNRKIEDAELLDYARECNLLINPDHKISDFDFEAFRDGFEGLSYLLLAHKLVQKEIELVVVTDHNTIRGFPKLVEALKILKDSGGKEIKKYPQIVLGVEISCSDKNHIVGIFNHLTTTSMLNVWLDEYIMSPKDGTYLTSIDVLDKIQELGGLGYIAHVNSSDIFQKGYLSKTYKKKLFNSMSLNLLGLSDLSKENRISDKLKNFTKRRFDFILDEDSHSIMDLGEKHFWIKAQKLGFQAIKNAMKDFDISTSFEEPTKPEGFIKALYIENKGFLRGKNQSEDFTITFSEAMNSFIGGRGTGKSTVLNTLDFLLSQSIESETTLKNICSQGSSCLLYSFKNEDYYIFFNGSGDKINDQTFILKYYNYTENSLYAVPFFDNKRARNVAIGDRINVYQYNGVKPIHINYKHRDILNSVYSHMFSVNDLVAIASGKNINSFIIDLMSKNSIIGKQKRINSNASIKWIKNKNEEMSIILSERLKEVMSLIDNFNQKQNDKLRILYYQKKLNEVEFPWIEIFNITSGNGTSFFRKYNISKINLYSYLKELTEVFNPLEVVILFYERKYKEIINAVAIGQFLNRDINKRMIDADIEKIDSNNITNFMDEIRSIIEGSLNTVTNYIKEYIHTFDDFNLEFNIHNKEMNSTKKPLFKKVSNLSMGQKVVAMLSFILAYSDYSEDYTPLIIDQPEDNLDNQYIYKNLVNDLRRSKSQRQVIVATHNSTIVTNTGSEQVIVMESDGESGWIETTGYPTEISITKQIINKLEGGEDAFRQKVFLYDEVIKD